MALAQTQLAEQLKFNLLFSAAEIQPVIGIIDPVFETIYQTNLFFSNNDQTRPILYGCFVTSIDGKIAFPDQPQGPLIAKMNQKDSEGAALDWWLLNALRASCDGLIFGVNTLVQEPNLTGHVYDIQLQQMRENLGKQAVPWNIIMTRESEHVPWHHQTFEQAEIPLIIVTTSQQVAACQQRLEATNRQVVHLRAPQTLDSTTIYLVDCLEQGLAITMQFLKACGLGKVLVESPTLSHALIEAQLLDEIFVTQSGIYIGGNALTIGQQQSAFTSVQHPHTRVLSIHEHQGHFLYLRYRFDYRE